MIAPYFCIGAVDNAPSPILNPLAVLINRVGKRFIKLIGGLSHQTTY